jgi:hypothetical protein
VAVSKDGLQYRFVIPGTRYRIRAYTVSSFYSMGPLRRSSWKIVAGRPANRSIHWR